MPATPAHLLRQLHAAGRRHGLTHDDLRSALGVTSLTVADPEALRAYVAQLNADRPAPRAVRTPRGVIRAATPLQRRTILATLESLAWTAAQVERFLLAQLNTVDVEHGHFDTRAASRAITHLRAALRKSPATHTHLESAP